MIKLGQMRISLRNRRPRLILGRQVLNLGLGMIRKNPQQFLAGLACGAQNTKFHLHRIHSLLIIIHHSCIFLQHF